MTVRLTIDINEKLVDKWGGLCIEGLNFDKQGKVNGVGTVTAPGFTFKQTAIQEGEFAVFVQAGMVDPALSIIPPVKKKPHLSIVDNKEPVDKGEIIVDKGKPFTTENN